MPVNYYNKYKEQLYVLHFPGNSIKMEIIDDNLDRKISMSNHLSIISIMNSDCFNQSFIKQQAEKNKFSIVNTAMDERHWNNILKIKHIIDCLNLLETEYALIIDGRDTIITNNLDDEFINKYKDFHIPILFNGTQVSHPNVAIEPLTELVNTKGKAKYLNAGVCIGEVHALKELYSKARDIQRQYPNNSSEQLIIRKARQELLDLVGIDSMDKLFKTIHQKDTMIKEIQEGRMII